MILSILEGTKKRPRTNRELGAPENFASVLHDCSPNPKGKTEYHVGAYIHGASSFVSSTDRLMKARMIALPSVLLVSATLFYLYENPFSQWRQDVKINYHNSPPSSENVVSNSARTRLVKQCDLFSGNWVPFAKGPYYTNATKCVIDDRQNCMKFGRPDTEFMRWKWKPNECDLPLFDATKFLELVRGKSMAFIGDSLARNQMQSLVCLLASVADPVDVSYVEDTRFRRWFYVEYNFTLAAFWSTYLVRSEEADPNGYSLTSLMKLYLDEIDETWAGQIQNFSYVIISAGQWFLRPLLYYEKGKIVGCYSCNKTDVTSLTRYYGYKMVFRTSFRTLLNLENFKGITFLRTISPQHYENGEWNKGGSCLRTRPVGKHEITIEEYILEFYWTQIAELRAAQREGRKRGLKFRLLDATELMMLRPDGHPSHYGHGPGENITIADCVHWCLPGPIDTWNEVLLEMLNTQNA